jgi:hypothetical protein
LPPSEEEHYDQLQEKRWSSLDSNHHHSSYRCSLACCFDNTRRGRIHTISPFYSSSEDEYHVSRLRCGTVDAFYDNFTVEQAGSKYDIK